MRNLLLTMMIIMTSMIYAQQTEGIVTTTQHLERIDDQYYKVTFKDQSGDITQKGYYTVDKNDNLIMDGSWKLYANGKKITSAYYENGEMVWIRTSKGKFTNTEINYLKLKSKVRRLERELDNATIVSN